MEYKASCGHSCGCKQILPLSERELEEISQARKLPCLDCVKKECAQELLRAAVCAEEPVLIELANFFGYLGRHLYSLPSSDYYTPVNAGVLRFMDDKRRKRFLAIAAFPKAAWGEFHLLYRKAVGVSLEGVVCRDPQLNQKFLAENRWAAAAAVKEYVIDKASIPCHRLEWPELARVLRAWAKKYGMPTI